MKRRKVKLVYKVIGIYLVSHFIIALSILTLMGVGIQTIQANFLQRYRTNATQHMEYFDEELLGLQNLLMYMMHSENILVLSHQYEQLSDYDKVRRKKQAKEEINIVDTQYKWVSDIGIYIPEQDLWITSLDWFRPDEAVKGIDEEGMYFLQDTLYLIEKYENKKESKKGYIRLDPYELTRLMEKLKFNEEVYIEVLLNHKKLEVAPFNAQEKPRASKELIIKSSLYPIEFRIYLPNYFIDFGHDFYILSLLALIVLCFITIRFAKYLNRAIHKPLQNVVSHIENMNADNFNQAAKHEGIDEFEYVTESLNKTKGLLENYIKKSYEQEIDRKQMELSHLQGQIKPHFLYNCFFNIANMCKTYDVDKIEQLTLGLAKYYRYITRTSYAFVKLEEEYAHMRHYISIQQIRFEDRVEIKIDELPEKLQGVCVPRLILQPIVENAYKYVFEKIEVGGQLQITAKEQEGYIRIQVEDNGESMSLEQIEHLRDKIKAWELPVTGLVNIKKRVQYIHEKNDIMVNQGKLGGLAVTLQIYIEN